MSGPARAFVIGASLALAYLGATALWSPVERWWVVPDTMEYIDAASSPEFRAFPAYRHSAYGRPPLYQLFLRAIGAGTDSPPIAIMALHVLSICLFAASAAGIARRTAAGVIAAVVALPAVPGIHTDPVGVALMAAACAAFAHGMRTERVVWTFGAGLLIAVAALTKQVGAPFILLIPVAGAVAGWTSRARILSFVVPALLIVSPWVAHVHSRTGITGVATQDLWFMAWGRAMAGVAAEGDPARQPAEVRRRLDSMWVSVPPDARADERREWAIERVREGIQGHYGDLAKYAVKNVFYVLLSTPRPWERQFPGLIPRGVVRVLAVGLFGLFVVGASAVGRQCGWRTLGALGILWLPSFGLSLFVGASISDRHMLPVAFVNATLYAYGAIPLWIGVKGATLRLVRRFGPRTED